MTRPVLMELLASRRGFCAFLLAVALQLLLLAGFVVGALAAQSPVGTWAAEAQSVLRGIPVTEQGLITFAPDGSYVARRRLSWEQDGLPMRVYSFAQGTWRLAADSLCVKREDRQAEVCQPLTVTAHTLRWGAFEFVAAGE